MLRIGILNYQQDADTIKALGLLHLLELDINMQTRYYVLDQGCSKTSSEQKTALSKYMQEIQVHMHNSGSRYIKSYSNWGVAGGRQRLIDIMIGDKLNKNDYILMMDNDAFPVIENLPIKHMISKLEKLSPLKIMAVGDYGVELSPKGDILQDIDGLVHALSGNSMYRAEVFLWPFGCEYDPAYNPFWHEDLDLSMQIRQAGGHLYAFPKQTLFEHIPRHTTADRSYFKNVEYFKMKWKNTLPSLLDEIIGLQ